MIRGLRLACVFLLFVGTTATAGEAVLGERSSLDLVPDRIADPNVDLSQPESAEQACIYEQEQAGMDWDEATAECEA